MKTASSEAQEIAAPATAPVLPPETVDGRGRKCGAAERAETPQADFFAGPGAERDDFDIRSTAWKKPAARCDVASKPKPKKADLNRLQRDWFVRNGWTYAKVETPNTFGACTVDLWNFADYLACKPGSGFLLVQTCSAEGGDRAKRERKIRKAPEFPRWVETGGHVQIHGWKQTGGKGSRWEVVIREIVP